MTDFFQYDPLTWPEVAALPRDIPLILPLGEGYSLDRLTSALGEPTRAGLLPPIPFGWQDSGLMVSEAIFGRYLTHLLDSLRDDGFSRCFVLTPQGIHLGLGASRIPLPRGWEVQTRTPPSLEPSFARSPSPHLGEGENTQIPGSYEETGGKEPVTIPPDSERGKVVLLPIGHTEQHGYHLPLSVDTTIIEIG